MTEVNHQLDPEEILGQLSPGELDFLQITALLDGEPPRDELFRIIKTLRLAPGSLNEWQPETATGQLQQLRRLGLVSANNRCLPEINEIVARRPIDPRSLELCRQLVRSSYLDKPQAEPPKTASSDCRRILRNFRLALYSHDFENLQKYLSLLYRSPYDKRFRHPYASLTMYPFDPEWFKSLPLPLQFAALDDCLTHSLEDLVASPQIDNFICEQYPAERPGSRPFILLYAHKLLLSGRLRELTELYSLHEQLFIGSGLRGAIAASQGNFNDAATYFNHDLKQAASLNPDQPACFDAPISFFHILTRGHCPDSHSWYETSTALNEGSLKYAYNPFTRDLFHLAECLLRFFQGLTENAHKNLTMVEKRPARSIFTLLNGLVSFWLHGVLDETAGKQLATIADQAETFPWLIREHLFFNPSSATASPATDDCRLPPLAPKVNVEPTWRRTLTALKQIDHDHESSGFEGSESQMRLAWFIQISPPAELQITPKIQKFDGNGWSGGRNLALNRVFDGEEFPFFTLQDRRIFATLIRSTDEKGECFSFDQEKAIRSLIDHPLLFRHGDRQVPVRLNQGQVKVMVEKAGANGEVAITLTPRFGSQENLLLEESENRFTFYHKDKKIKEIEKLLGQTALILPPEASPDLSEALEKLIRLLPVYSDLPLSRQQTAQPGPAIYLQIFPAGSGLRFDLAVKPLGNQGPILQPGRGKPFIALTFNSNPLVAQRDLEAEIKLCNRLRTACPQLATTLSDQDSAQLDDLEACLMIIEEIQSLQQEISHSEDDPWMICEWPAGRKIGLKESSRISTGGFRIKSRQNWFEIEGELKIDEDETLSLLDALKSLKKTPGRFLALGDRQFIALNQDLRQRLNNLSFFLDEEGNQLSVHRAAAANVADLLEGFTVSESQDWSQLLERLKNTADYQPEIPVNLNAELRGYQREGFYWLARLAHLGFGACLADDMGLGKTLQTLTLMLSRSSGGPSLVVAPTSVCANWQKECHRFTPDLKAIMFGAGDRAEQIKQLGPGDLLICSYTMLQQERELLTGRLWEIIVLDEAQAIKNLQTKRSRAAMSLKGKFRLITTGTPMENHLGELWNLFNFINPGLLGSLDYFNRRFAHPIEQEKSAAARKRLREIIQPYMLRRHKSHVLKELPPRTDILLEVEMTPEESSFYEAMRRQAVSRLEEIEGQAKATRTSVQVLAELTRLRLAACNPRLIDSTSQVESSKLKHFGRVVDDLLAGGHRALVFSQFVKHLDLIRKFLEDKSINYRYLDGSTPKNRRQEEIKAFQEGNADLFLISLKAGGLGLNLTAADYVIHLDPWWNPAVEDQASDRAHRIGQTRPVTVYRLISRSTIEEKIVRLHQDKRDLADQILAAADQSARFSTAELLHLIKEN